MTESVNKANQLCMRCGMCCDGTMFQKATVEAAEKEQVISSGLLVNEHNGKLSFAQPCKFYCNNQCSIYLQRPKVCTKFRCQLLKKLNKDEISLEAALEKVKMVRDLQKGLAELMPDAKHIPITYSEAYDKSASIDQSDMMQRKKHAMFLMLATKFEVQLSDHFWHKIKQSESESESDSDDAIALGVLQKPNHKM